MDSNDLIAKAQRTDRMVRTIRIILTVVIMAMLVFIAVLSTQTNEQLRTQLKTYHQQNQQVSSNTQQIISEMKRQNDLQTEYIRCIAKAFNSQTHIADLDSCQTAAVANGLSPVSGTPAPSTVPFHTDPVTQEPTQPTATPKPTPSPTPKPSQGLLSNPISALIKALGL